MLEQLVKNTRELNRAAAHLRSMKEFGRIKALAEKWMVPDSYVEDFISGKRAFLADIDIEEKIYKNANAKLAEELHALSDESFADIIGAYLCRKCRDREYEKLVLQRHKTLQKCLNYILKQAYGEAEKKHGEGGMRAEAGVGIAMSSTMVFRWADEYYRLDDAVEEAKKREKAKEDFQKAKKEAAGKKTREKEREREKVKSGKKEDVQLSLDFSALG